jgi:hypothetical protein
LFVINVVAFILGEPEQKDCAIGSESDQHPKPASFALARPCDSLLDKAAAKISIDQPALCGFDRGQEVFIPNGFAFRKPAKSFGLEDAHKHLYSFIYYRFLNYNSRKYMTWDRPRPRPHPVKALRAAFTARG